VRAMVFTRQGWVLALMAVSVGDTHSRQMYRLEGGRMCQHGESDKVTSASCDNCQWKKRKIGV
jgi:hypothetical protein